MSLIDMTGKQFGRLTVLALDRANKHGAAMWRCRCECGKGVISHGGSLRSGRIKSCGCIHPRLDLTGNRYGELIVSKIHAGRGKRGQVLWECLCDCGDTAIVKTENLRSGNSKSCGHWRRYTGDKSIRWDPDRSIEDRDNGRNEKKLKVWRNEVYLRDDYTCQKCRCRGGDLHVHHIVPYAKSKVLQYEPENGATLCVKCHREFHRLHGNTCTESDFMNWTICGTIA